jgi:hypothetical protein
MKRFSTLSFMEYAPTYHSRTTKWVPVEQQQFPVFVRKILPFYAPNGQTPKFNVQRFLSEQAALLGTELDAPVTWNSLDIYE